jgi:type II secretion system protein C
MAFRIVAADSTPGALLLVPSDQVPATLGRYTCGNSMRAWKMDEKHIVKLLWVVRACLLAVLAYAGFEVVATHLHLGRILGPDTACGDQFAANKQAAPPVTRTPSDYTAIIERNLFVGTDNVGNSQSVLNPSQTLGSLASAEELGLRLVGTIAGGPAASRAIIQDTKSNTTGVYKTGDAVACLVGSPNTQTRRAETPHIDAAPQAGVTVEAIHRDAVILHHEGRSLVLRLCAGTGADNKSNSSKDKPQRAKDAYAASPANAQPQPRLDRAESVAEIFRKAKIEPYVKGNRTEGLRITGMENIPMAQVLGLQNGDVVQSVNGQPLTSKQKAFQILMKAKTQSKVDIQLLRDGKNKELSFNL